MRLFTEPATDSVDQYGRLLRYVVRVNGAVNVNIRLVAVGAAAPYFYRGRIGRYAARLESLAKRARAKKLGLWVRVRTRLTIPTGAFRHAADRSTCLFVSLTPGGRYEIVARNLRTLLLACGRRIWRSGTMFNVSRNVLVVLALIAIVLFVLGIATDVGLIGWVLAIIVGAYVIAALVRQRRTT